MWLGKVFREFVCAGHTVGLWWGLGSGFLGDNSRGEIFQGLSGRLQSSKDAAKEDCVEIILPV